MGNASYQPHYRDQMERDSFLRLYQTLVQEKAIKPLDWLLLCRFAAEPENLSGRAEISLSQIAKEGGFTEMHCRQALTRLRDRDLIRKGRTNCGYYFMVNPLLFNRANQEGANKNALDQWMRRYQSLEGPKDRRRVPSRGLQATFTAMYA